VSCGWARGSCEVYSVDTPLHARLSPTLGPLRSVHPTSVSCHVSAARPSLRRPLEHSVRSPRSRELALSPRARPPPSSIGLCPLPLVSTLSIVCLSLAARSVCQLHGPRQNRHGAPQRVPVGLDACYSLRSCRCRCRCRSRLNCGSRPRRGCRSRSRSRLSCCDGWAVRRRCARCHRLPGRQS
jgi:hypothetical protein